MVGPCTQFRLQPCDAGIHAVLSIVSQHRGMRFLCLSKGSAIISECGLGAATTSKSSQVMRQPVQLSMT